MEHLKITVKTKEEARLLAEITRQLKFVISVDFEEAVPESTFASDDDFLNDCGIWKDREISIEALRNQAWRKISL
jgi:hypothetical protein